jgi:glycosyltransferase involved in cell wall biosynthesis
MVQSSEAQEVSISLASGSGSLPATGPASVHQPTIAVIVPCFKVRDHVIDVVARMPACVSRIYCVDDACPDQSGRLLEQSVSDPRLSVIYRERNGGVGAAVCTGYQAALEAGYDILVKVDGDGQMAPELIPYLVGPIQDRLADYAKGNRFFSADDVMGMPRARLLGNAALSFVAKLSTGYWDIFDPTNGFTAVHAKVLERINLSKLAGRYFFETDLLFRLGCLNARVVDVPMAARYGDEVSNLKISRAVFTFLGGHLRNIWKRIVYSYFLRDFSLGSMFFVFSVLLLIVGASLGVWFWVDGIASDRPATAGQVMFAALPLIFSLQFALSFVGFDIARTPRHALHPLMRRRRGG